MKVLILTLVLIGVSYSYAQVDSAKATLAFNTGNGYINSLRNKATSERIAFQSDLATNANKIYAQMTATKNQLSIRFGTFGTKGLASKVIMQGDMDDSINSLKSQLNPDTVKAILQTTLNNLRVIVVDPRYPELEDLKTAINKNEANYACWDNNKLAVKSIADKLIKEAQPFIDNEVIALRSALIAVTSHIKLAGDVFDNDLKACNSNDVCGNKYITANYAAFSATIDKETAAASTALRNAIGKIFAGVKSKCNDANAEYAAGPKAQIIKCLV